jgi:hypothetical protein
VRSKKIDQREKVTVAPLTHREIVDLVGEIEDAKAIAIIATQGTFKDLEEAVAWAAGETDVMGEAEQPLAGAAARIFDILTADEEVTERRSP